MTRYRGRVDMLVRPWFLVLLAVGAIHQVLQKVAKVSQPLLDAYLDPLLFMPILLHLMLWERRVLFGKGPDYILESWRIITTCVLVSVMVEVVFPRISPRFTADIVDVACYMVGSAVFALIWNKPAVTS